MNFEWTDEQKALRDAVANVLDELGGDLAVAETAGDATLREITMRLLRHLGEAGYLSRRLDRGGGDETMALYAAQEELARRSGSLFFATEVSARLVARLVEEHGSQQLIDEVAAPLRAGKEIAALAVDDAHGFVDSDTDAASARWDGEHYLLSGRKALATNGPIAGWLAVSAKVEGRTAVFFLDRGLPGLGWGPRLRTVGFNGVAICAADFYDVLVPEYRVLGPFDDAAPLEALHTIEDLILTVAAIGVMDRAFASARDFAKEHKRGGKRLTKHQEVGFPLAEMLTALETARWLGRRAAWQWSAADSEVETTVRCAKVFAAEAVREVTSKGLSVLGGEGFLSGNAVERAYREAQLVGVGGNSVATCQRLIAAALTRRYEV